jgi:hypothetical protein
MNDEVIGRIKEKLDTFHSLFKSCRLKAEYWEEVLFQALTESGYENVNWEAHSHKIGEDLNIDNDRISCKSGKIVNKRFLRKKCLEISSHRTTTYKTLEEKLDFLSVKLVDTYFCLVNPNPRDKSNLSYHLYIFDAKIIDVNKLRWTKVPSGWTGVGYFMAKIVKKMSDQLWLSIPLELLPKPIDMGDYK